MWMKDSHQHGFSLQAPPVKDPSFGITHRRSLKQWERGSGGVELQLGSESPTVLTADWWFQSFFQAKVVKFQIFCNSAVSNVRLCCFSLLNVNLN